MVYDHARGDLVARIRSWAALHDIILAGRYSEWEYYNSDHAFLAGRTAAEKVGGLRQRDTRYRLRRTRRSTDRARYSSGEHGYGDEGRPAAEATSGPRM